MVHIIDSNNKKINKGGKDDKTENEIERAPAYLPPMLRTRNLKHPKAQRYCLP